VTKPLPIHDALEQNLYSPQARNQNLPSPCTFQQSFQSVVRDMLEASYSEAVRKLPQVHEALVTPTAKKLQGWPDHFIPEAVDKSTHKNMGTKDLTGKLWL